MGCSKSPGRFRVRAVMTTSIHLQGRVYHIAFAVFCQAGRERAALSRRDKRQGMGKGTCRHALTYAHAPAFAAAVACGGFAFTNILHAASVAIL